MLVILACAVSCVANVGLVVLDLLIGRCLICDLFCGWVLQDLLPCGFTLSWVVV